MVIVAFKTENKKWCRGRRSSLIFYQEMLLWLLYLTSSLTCYFCKLNKIFFTPFSIIYVHVCNRIRFLSHKFHNNYDLMYIKPRRIHPMQPWVIFISRGTVYSVATLRYILGDPHPNVLFLLWTSLPHLVMKYLDRHITRDGVVFRGTCHWCLLYIVMYQRGGVSNKPPWFQAATRQGPGIL